MANIGGFEIETPQEVMGRVQARIDQMRTSGDPNVVNAANSQQVIGALFGSPESRQAQARQDGLTGALGSVSQNEGESEADFQVRQQTAVREKMAAIDPQIALQANDNILRIQSEALQQRRLGIQTDTNEFELKNALATAVDAKTPYIFRRSPTGDTTAVASLPPEATAEEVDAERARLQNADPQNSYVVGNGTDRNQLEDFDVNETGGLNKSAVRKIEESLEASAELMRNGTGLINQLKKAPQALTKGAALVAESNTIAEGLRRVAGQFKDSITGEDRDLSEAELAQDAARFAAFAPQQELLRDLGVESGIAEGLIVNLAYSLAKTLDPGGRLSDQDVEMAIRMLAGRGTPEELRELMKERFADAQFKAEGHKSRALSGALNGQFGVEKYNRYAEQRDIFNKSLEEFSQIIEQGGLVRMNPKIGQRKAPATVKANNAATPQPSNGAISFTVRK